MKIEQIETERFRSPDEDEAKTNYNAARNDPFVDHHHPRYTPLEKVADADILAAGIKFSDAAQQDPFLAQSVAPAELTEKSVNLFTSDVDSAQR